jgi:hypothetical protein
VRGDPNFELRFDSEVTAVEQDSAGVDVTITHGS